MSKITFVLGGIVGYILGARAGHDRYEQIVDAGKQVWENPRVQEGRHKVETTVREQVPVLKEKANETAEKAGAAASAKAGEVAGKAKNAGQSGNSGETKRPEPPHKTPEPPHKTPEPPKH